MPRANSTGQHSRKGGATCFSLSSLLSKPILFILATHLLLLQGLRSANVESQNNLQSVENADQFREDLFIKPLLDGKLFVEFQFKTIYRGNIKDLRWENKIQLFPLSLAELISISDINALHFSLTKGNWNYRHWGYPTRSNPPGAQIRVRFSQHNKSTRKSWNRLVNLLDGKFCASLDSADEFNSVASKLSFGEHLLENSTVETYYSNLPEETMCTENLTPWKKLLPCYSNSGLASLLNAESLLQSSYSSLSIDIQPKDCIISGRISSDCEQVHLTQTFSIVFNPLRQFEGRQTWSLIKILGSSIQRACPLATSSRIHVDITNLDNKNKLFPQTFIEHNVELQVDSSRDIWEKRNYAVYDVSELVASQNATGLNIGVKQNQLFKHTPLSSRPTIPIYFRTNLAGSDGIVASIKNTNREPIIATYMDVVPHYLRVYLHTLVVKTTTGDDITPSKVNFDWTNSDRPSLIEITLTVPANTEVRIFYEFEKVFMRWTDYKPDANKGILVGSASISILYCCECMAHHVMPIGAIQSTTNSSRLKCNRNDDISIYKMYARPLLIVLPTPDFSMPYNVICLVCSILVFGFGPIHNLTTTRKPIPFSSKEKKE